MLSEMWPAVTIRPGGQRKSSSGTSNVSHHKFSPKAIGRFSLHQACFQAFHPKDSRYTGAVVHIYKRLLLIALDCGEES